LVKSDDIDNLAMKLLEAFKILRSSVKIVCIDEEIDLSASIDYINQQIKKYPDRSKQNIALEAIKNLIKENIELSVDSQQRTYYLITQASTLKELNSFNNFIYAFSGGEYINVVSVEEPLEILHVFNNIYAGANCPQRLFTNEYPDFYEHKTTTHVHFAKGYYQQQGRFHAVLDVYTYPALNDYGYFKPLFNIPDTTAIMDIVPIPQHNTKELINQLTVKTDANAEFVRGAYETMEYGVIKERIMVKLKDITSGDLNML
jgi:hypothetical protein